MKRTTQRKNSTGTVRLGKQIGVITYGGGINVAHYAEEAKKRGFVIFYDRGFARIHEKAETGVC